MLSNSTLALATGFFGLLIGSFLNVVIHRLPKMMERRWEQECETIIKSNKDPTLLTPPSKPSFNLCQPKSHCRACHHSIKWYENIPIISFLLLKGQCSRCGAKIGWRYPIIELTTAALYSFCIYRWGFTITGFFWCLFSSALLVLAVIDWDTTLLPDDITLPLIWAGLLASTLGWLPTQNASDSVIGATVGYLSLWSIYWAFKLCTGKEGMGYGDFKLFAALGAWFGTQALIPIILAASLIGAVVGISLKFFNSLREGGYIPFGPFLAGAGFMTMIFGPEKIWARFFT